VIQVACGVLQGPAGEMLLAQRPAGKLAAGKWEFPGGKIEAGESARDALVREFEEELGVEVLDARPLARLRQDYADRCVWLDTWLVTRFANEPEPREGQRLLWQPCGDLGQLDVLPSCWRVAAALRLPRDYVFTRPDHDLEELLQGLERLPPGALLRLRLPSLQALAYEQAAARVIVRARTLGIGVVLDRDPGQVEELQAAGWHATAASLRALTRRPVSRSRWFFCSAHDEGELQQAHRAGADAAVLGAVLPTPSHPGGVALGWTHFASLAAGAGLPVFALGGVGPRERAFGAGRGAFGIAGISAYWS